MTDVLKNERVFNVTPGQEQEFEEMVLTSQDAKTYDDFEEKIFEVFENGATLYVPDLIGEDIFGYIMYDYAREENFIFTPVGEKPEFTETLKAEVRLKPEQVTKLYPSSEYYGTMEYVNFVESLKDSTLYDAAVTELLHKYPDLKGGFLEADDDIVMDNMYVEGKPVSEAISVILQKNDISDKQLKAVLTDVVAKEAFRTLVNADKKTELQYIRNLNYIYFYETGVLGHAKVDRDRGLTFRGETMSREAQQRIMEFVMNRNMKTEFQHAPFFRKPGLESELKLYLDTMKNELHKVYVQKDWDGKTLYTDGGKIIREEDVKSLQEITGRVTDAVITRNNGTYIRCKIDGEWQLKQKLTKAEIIRMPYFMDNREGMDNYALSVAVRHYATELYDTPEQKMGKGFSR